MDAVLERKNPLPMFATPDLIAEANHRIANSLALLVSMVRMQAVSVRKRADSFSGTEVRHMLDGIAARINTISQLHRLLSTAPGEGAISLQPHMRQVSDALVAALGSAEQEVRVEYTGDDCMVLMSHVQPIVLILCEIFINAVKYAHPSGVPLVMVVDCSSCTDGRLVISVSDDGVGLPEGFDPAQSNGLGFRVMRGLAAEIGGTLQIMSTHLGLSFRLSLPASAMAGTRLS